MKNKFANLLWGIVFIGLGIGFAGNAFNLWDFDLFFKGWWTLFIIIPCIISIVQNGFNIVNSFGVIVGIALLLSQQNIISSVIIGKLIFPIILVWIGLSIILKDIWRKSRINIRDCNHEGIYEYTAIFGGQDCQFAGEKFNGASLVAIFGGINFNLKDSIIDKDVRIDTTTIFGGADIIVPSNVKVKVISTPIFGGVSNKTIPCTNDDAPTIYFNSTCVFGGVDIK